MSALLKPRFQLIERFFRPIVFDSIPRAAQKMAVNEGMLGVSQVVFAVFVGDWYWVSGLQRTDFVEGPVPCWLEQEEHFGQFELIGDSTSIVSCK